MKSWIFLISMLAVLLPGTRAAVPDQPQAQQTVMDTNQSLQEIEAYFTKTRAGAEWYYADQVEELKLSADRKIKRMRQSEQAAFAEMEQSRRFWYFREHGVFPPDDLFIQDQIDSTEKRMAEEEQSILADLDQKILSLQEQTDYVLNSLIPYHEAQLKENLLNPKPEPQLGTVTGIVYGKDQQLALINREIVKVGDVFQGVRIVKIKPNAVEFEKNGKTWAQSPGQSPDKADWPE